MSAAVVPSPDLALAVWIAIKAALRKELGQRESKLWINHLRLWQVRSQNCLIVHLPRDGKVAWGVLRFKRTRLQAAARKFNSVGVILLMAPDFECRQLHREAIAAVEDPELKQKLLAKFQEAQRVLEIPYIEPAPSELWRTAWKIHRMRSAMPA